MKFWEFAAVTIAGALLKNAVAAGISVHPSEVARAAAEVADRLEEERVKRLKGAMPS